MNWPLPPVSGIVPPVVGDAIESHVSELGPAGESLTALAFTTNRVPSTIVAPMGRGPAAKLAVSITGNVARMTRFTPASGTHICQPSPAG